MKKSMWCLLAFVLLLSLPAFAATPSVAVIYPELREPFNKVFEDIASGVEKKVNGRTMRYVLSKELNVLYIPKFK